VAGNTGRVFGSRNRMSKRAARRVLRDFEASFDDVVPRMKRWFLPQYMSLIARLMPRVNETGGVDLDATDEIEMATIIGDVRAALDRTRAGKASFEDLENAFLGEGRHN
jgi:hypothetical protein